MRTTCAIISVILVVQASLSWSQQESLCSQLEDFALSVFQMKEQGVREIQIRRELDIGDDGPLNQIVTITYSDSRITEEFMLTQTRLQCSILALTSDERFAPDQVELDIDSGLPKVEWVAECMRQRWVFDNLKLEGRGTLLQRWNQNEEEAMELANFLLDRSEQINVGQYGPAEMAADEAAGIIGSFQGDIALDGSMCVVDQMRLE